MTQLNVSGLKKTATPPDETCVSRLGRVAVENSLAPTEPSMLSRHFDMVGGFAKMSITCLAGLVKIL